MASSARSIRLYWFCTHTTGTMASPDWGGVMTDYAVMRARVCQMPAPNQRSGKSAKLDFPNQD